MKTEVFTYDLPEELIAQHPPARRDQSRMMVLHRADGRMEHRCFADLPEILAPSDLLVLNNTRVIPARLFGRKESGGGKIEILLLEDLGGGVWDVLLRARRRPAAGSRIICAEGHATATMMQEGELGRARVRFETTQPFDDILDAYGDTPLPPYIKRVSGDQCAVTGGDKPITGHRTPDTDRERYQTVYARERGSVAAPTAGLHFTPEIFARLDAKGVKRVEITLHIGLGTFRPVTAERVEDHRMEPERFSITAEAAAAIRAAPRVVAVGSTSVRTLEYVAATRGQLEAASGRADLFIYPPYEFKVVGAMLTNFHLPKSTLLMMVCAFAGTETVLRAYAEAVRERYRFYSYGDCMLIL